MTVLPSNSSAQTILSQNLDGLLLSNGPGDPANVKQPLEEIKKLVGELPIMGICMGHQLLGLALGGSTFKLKFGHRGANHPIKDLDANQVFMSSQNHGYALSKDFKDHTVKVTHCNLNDGSVAGIKSDAKSVFSVQFHPEHCPGPEEGAYLFNRFSDLIQSSQRKLKKAKAATEAATEVATEAIEDTATKDATKATTEDTATKDATKATTEDTATKDATKATTEDTTEARPFYGF